MFKGKKYKQSAELIDKSKLHRFPAFDDTSDVVCHFVGSHHKLTHPFGRCL